MPLIKEMAEILNDLQAAGYPVQRTSKGHHLLTHPITGEIEMLGGGNARGIRVAKRKLHRKGFTEADGRTPVPLPKDRTGGQTPGDRLLALLEAAQACTGQEVPEDWQRVGDDHLRQTCACHRPATEETPDVTATAPTNALVLPKSSPEPLQHEIDDAVLLVVETAPKTLVEIHSELVGVLFEGTNWAKVTPEKATATRIERLVREGRIHEADRIGVPAVPRYAAGPRPVERRRDTSRWGSGVSASEWVILETLIEHGGSVSNKSGRATAVLHEASGLQVHPRSMTNLLQGLTVKGFVSRKTTGKRTYRIEVTDEGRRALQQTPRPSVAISKKRALTPAPEPAPAPTNGSTNGSTPATSHETAQEAPTSVPTPEPAPTPRPAPPAPSRPSTGDLDPSSWELNLQDHTRVTVTMSLADFVRITEALGLS